MVTERSSTISLTRPETTISSACADPKRSASVPPGARRTLGPSGRARNYGARAEARLGRIVEAPHDEEAETGKVGSHRGHELREERGIRFMATTAAGIPIVTAVSRPPPPREASARRSAALLRFCCCRKLRTAGFPLLIGSV